MNLFSVSFTFGSSDAADVVSYSLQQAIALFWCFNMVGFGRRARAFINTLELEIWVSCHRIDSTGRHEMSLFHF